MAIDSLTTSPSLPNPPSNQQKLNENETATVFDFSKIKKEPIFPEQFIWPDEETPSENAPELQVPSIDLMEIASGDESAIDEAKKLVDEACRKHGFFAIVNHGVSGELIREAHELMEKFFESPFEVKERAQRKGGEKYGYASSFMRRFVTKLPWKETLTLRYRPEEISNTVEHYICNTLGEEFMTFGKVYQEYCEAMSNLSLRIMELLGLSLGVPKEHFRKFFEDNDSIMRLNYYPPCQKPDLTLGTGPHRDPASLTILHQDQVCGLQVFVDNQWQSITPNFDSFVINIGDTFMAHSNGLYKSCLHRAVVNSKQVRKSLTFFLSPEHEKVVAPPRELVEAIGRRVYPDFTWKMLLEFIHKYYRADMNTLDSFSNWVLEHKKPT